MSDWIYRGEIMTEMPAGIVAFVYRLTNDKNGKCYLGQKSVFKKIKRPPLKGKKIKRNCIVESDWRTYFGSSEKLKADIRKHGKKHFTREILDLCQSKSEANYLELLHQIDEGVLFRDDWYNGIINVRINANQLTDDFKRRMTA